MKPATWIRQLRRRLCKALIAYARTALRTKNSKGPPILAARKAALVQVGRRGAVEAEPLSDIESDGDPTHALLPQGATKPLVDLVLDWQHWGARGDLGLNHALHVR